MKKTNKRDLIKKHIEKITTPIFKKVLQETLHNPMRVTKRPKKVFSKAVQPHNYRLYFDYLKDRYNPTQPYLSKNYNSEHHYTFSTHRITIRKKTIEVCYLGHKKQWRKIEADSEEAISQRIEEIDKDIETKCFGYVKDFIEKNGGKSAFILMRKRKQDWGIHGDDFLDNIPDDLIIKDTVFKKVYRQKVEFTDANKVKNYITNKALMAFSPIIAKEINNLANQIIKPLDRLKQIIKDPQDIIDNQELINQLNPEEREDLSQFLFIV